MRTDIKTQHQTLTEEQRRALTLRLSKLSVDSNVFEGSSDLPQVFQVKYLGSHDARGLWGIRHTRKPVDGMVAAAKSLPSGTILPFVKLVIGEDGVGLLPLVPHQHHHRERRRRGSAGGSTTAAITNNNNPVTSVADDPVTRIFPIESISYGVQDLVYTRVFSMIVVRDSSSSSSSSTSAAAADNRHQRHHAPFECHGFVCESKHHARQMTHALAAAFQIYSQHVRERTDDPAAKSWGMRGFALELGSGGAGGGDIRSDEEEVAPANRYTQMAHQEQQQQQLAEGCSS